MPSKNKKLSVYLNDKEYVIITARAAQAGLSFSRFARAVCLGWELKSLDNPKAILELTHIRGDMDRLGGLLKLWLSKPEDNHMTTMEIRRLLRELENTRSKASAAIDKLETGR